MRCFLSLCIILTDQIPVDHLEKILQILSSIVSGIDIVGMLPDIYSEQYLLSLRLGERVVCIGGIEDFELTISSFDQPSSPRSKISHRRSDKLLLKSLKRSKTLIQILIELSTWHLSKVWTHYSSKKIMIPVLCCIVKNRSTTLFYDLFQRKPLKLSSYDEFIEIIYIGLMMLVIVIRHRLLWNIRRQCSFCIWQWLFFKSHC